MAVFLGKAGDQDGVCRDPSIRGMLEGLSVVAMKGRPGDGEPVVAPLLALYK